MKDGSLFPLLLVLAGAALGLASSLIVSLTKQKQDVMLKLLDKYLEIRSEVVDVVSNLTHIDNAVEFDEEERAELRDNIAKLFYRHYDFLPEEVLDALLLLSVCLFDSAGNLYSVEDRMITRLPEADIVEFIKRCSVYRNAELIAPLALKSGSQRIRYNQAIKLHARNVLYTLNRFASLKELMAMANRFQKYGRKDVGRTQRAAQRGILQWDKHVVVPVPNPSLKRTPDGTA